MMVRRNTIDLDIMQIDADINALQRVCFHRRQEGPVAWRMLTERIQQEAVVQPQPEAE